MGKTFKDQKRYDQKKARRTDHRFPRVRVTFNTGERVHEAADDSTGWEQSEDDLRNMRGQGLRDIDPEGDDEPNASEDFDVPDAA